MRNRILLLSILSALLYLPSVFGGFMWDDEDIITGDPVVHSMANAARVFSPGYWQREFPGAESRYRPMRSVLLIGEWKMFGASPAGYHVVRVLLNSAAACLALWLAFLIFKDQDKALVAALVFAFHPVHVESVAWLKNVTDLLMFIFTALAAGMAVKTDEAEPGAGPARLAVVLLLFSAALFSKESAVMVPAAVTAWLVLLKRVPVPAALRRTLPMWVLGAVFLAFIVYFLRRSEAGLGPFDFKGAVLAFAQYSRLLFLPFGLNAERGVVTALDAAGPLLLAALLVYALRAGNREALFSAAWIVLFLAPFLDTRFTVGRPIAEQRLYAASLGAGLAFGALYRPGRLSRYAAGALCLLFFGVSARRNFDWLDPVRFWEKTSAASPVSARARNNLGVSYERARRFPDAVREYELAVNLDPAEEGPYLNAADLLYKLGRGDEAERIYSEIYSKRPGSRRAALGLSRLLAERGRVEEALAVGLNLLKFHPGDAEGLNSAGVAYMMLGKGSEAEASFRAVLASDPGNEQAYYNLAAMHLRAGRNDLAAAAYEDLLRVSPGHPDALNNLAIMSDMSGDEARALELFRKASAASPDYAPAVFNLGEIYYRKKMYLEALSEYTKALSIDPKHASARRRAEETRRILDENSRK